MRQSPERVNAWIDDVLARHTRELSHTEFLKALRALSARYVERRAELPHRSALDSAGKRAAFAAFFAPLHFLTMSEVIGALGATEIHVDEILDLGCGTGASSAAWARAAAPRPTIRGIDRNPWVLVEAARTWNALGVRGQARRGDVVRTAAERAAALPRRASRTAVLLAWSVNELDAHARAALLPSLVRLARGGSSVLVIEPLARSAVPWWDEWAGAWRAIGGRTDEWTFDVRLPPALADISEAAGFRRESLGARTLWHGRPRG